MPDNGLVLYCGTILTGTNTTHTTTHTTVTNTDTPLDDGKEKRVNIDFEPFKPINTSLYLCDNKFHTGTTTTLLLLLPLLLLLLLLLSSLLFLILILS